MPRSDTATRLIGASAEEIYAAWVDPEALAEWLPPEGMTARFDWFDLRPGGTYRMVLTYAEPTLGAGKATSDTDVIEARFIELVPNQRMVQEVDFVSDDPAYAGTMRMTWLLTSIEQTTRVDFVAEGVPDGISAEDNAAVMSSSLANLAGRLED